MNVQVGDGMPHVRMPTYIRLAPLVAKYLRVVLLTMFFYNYVLKAGNYSYKLTVFPSASIYYPAAFIMFCAIEEEHQIATINSNMEFNSVPGVESLEMTVPEEWPTREDESMATSEDLITLEEYC
ncbi:hypothetical protein PNOK_0831400 [Pyrrhoderma noxium]|uniref:Uncharacterized protein n=1 Tax=Pyrrhoderma noxium TaxID=2282107 RepID=A0A286UAZ6_9AGAM|nr:hypothetical protein PNOK_0831400 [Pyrrhoderma noxium]